MSHVTASRTAIVVAIVTSLLLCAPAAPGQRASRTGSPSLHAGPVSHGPVIPKMDPEDAHWATDFSMTGTNAQVRALLAGEAGNMYLAGEFMIAGATVAPGIARWDGTEFHALGGGLRRFVFPDGPEYPGTVWKLALGPDGSLYAAGEFNRAGDVVANGVARWDGAQWHALGEGVERAYSMAIDAGGRVFIGGYFTSAGGVSAKNIAMWDGGAWWPLGAGFDESVDALTIDPDGRLIAGARRVVGETYGVVVARWDGVAWTELGAGPPAQSVMAFEWDAEGRLVAGGSSLYQLPAGLESGVSVWDGATWSKLGGGVDDVFDVKVDRNGVLYTSGWFAIGSGHVADGVAFWNGEKWVAACSKMEESTAWPLAFDEENRLYLGGLFRVIEGVGVSNLARREAGVWSAVFEGNGIEGGLQTLAPDGQGGVFAGGSLRIAGTLPAKGVAHWDGSSWSELGSGIDGTVNALVRRENGELVAGGWFSTAGGAPADNVARWDGAQWWPVGAGAPGLYSLVASEAGVLFGAGSSSVVRLEGETWTTVGSVSGARVLVTSGDDLFVGGCFSSVSGQPIQGLARWDGASWSAVGGASFNCVTALLVDDAGLLYAGHSLGIEDGSTYVSGVSVWDGAVWRSVGLPFRSGHCLPGCIRALAMDARDRLMAGGTFYEAGGTAARNVARWDGEAWGPMGSGLNGEVLAISSGEVWMGGRFTMAGSSVSAGIARWNDSASELPLQIVSLDATEVSGDVLLTWRTEDDGLVARYDIEHSADRPRIAEGAVPEAGSAPWRKAGAVESRYVGQGGATYEFRVGGLDAGRHRFRVRQVDLDGQLWLSPEVEVIVPLRSACELAPVYPNPFSDRAHARLTVSATQHVTVDLYDALGRRVSSLLDGVLLANQPVELTLGGGSLAPGLYMLRVRGGSFERSVPVVRVE